MTTTFEERHTATESKNAAHNAISETADAAGWMAAVWVVRDGRVHLDRVTHYFPRPDFEVAERLLREANADDARPDIGPPPPPPLPFGKVPMPGLYPDEGEPSVGTSPRDAALKEIREAAVERRSEEKKERVHDWPDPPELGDPPIEEDTLQAEAMKIVAPIARKVGVSSGELSAILAKMADDPPLQKTKPTLSQPTDMPAGRGTWNPPAQTPPPPPPPRAPVPPSIHRGTNETAD